MIDTLYKTIGGRSRIQSAVTIFYEKVLADQSLRPFFDGLNLEHLRARQSMFLSMLLGGQFVYTGKDIGEAHEHPRLAGMTDVHFDVFIKHFRDTLGEVGVEAVTIDKVMALLEANRKTVLGR